MISTIFIPLLKLKYQLLLEQFLVEQFFKYFYSNLFRKAIISVIEIE